MSAVSPADIVAAIQACAALYPVVLEAPQHRVVAHAMTESGSRLHQFAIGVNEDKRRGLPAESHFPATEEAAIALARRLLADKRRVDVGLMGLTDRPSQDAEPGSQWAFYGLGLHNVFKVRENVCAGARILGADYQREINVRAACSYNSGDRMCRSKTGSNGYPERVERNAALAAAAAAAAPAPPAPTERPRTSDIMVRRRMERGESADVPPDPLRAAPSAHGSGPDAVASIAPGSLSSQ